MREQILLKRKYLLEDPGKAAVDGNRSAWLAAKLLHQFGITVTPHELLTEKHVRIIADFYGETIPKSFYSNPQDLKYYTCEELLIEQVVGYFLTYGHKEEGESQRIKVFEKVTPDYKEGTDVVFREYQIVSDSKAHELLFEIADNFAKYTRKFSENEHAEYDYLYQKGYAQNKLMSKDNAVEMFMKYPDPFFGQMLGMNDVVKLSIEMVGNQQEFKYTPGQRTMLFVAANHAYPVPLSKRQSKYFNTIVKKVGARVGKQDNSRSPHKRVRELMDEGKVLEAAKVYASQGTLLVRHLNYLLSRANPADFVKILDLVNLKNPIVALQFLEGLNMPTGPRVFKFYRDRKAVRHIETPEEARWRKSALTQGMKNIIKSVVDEKIDNFYRNLPKLGKVFIDPAFAKVAVPFNTSAMGDGIDVVTTGTRQKISEEFIRFFCYWKGIRDIDSSIDFVKKDGTTKRLSWQTYHGKPFGNSALTSGDDTSSNGAEWKDLNLQELEDLGWTHAIYALNVYGWGSDFSKGDCYCGYQHKSDLNTKTWDPKNIAMKIKAPQGKSREYTGFIVDIVNREIIVVNELMSGNARIMVQNIADYFAKYLNSDYVQQFNIARIAAMRADEVVSDPSLADVVFSDTHRPTVLQVVDEKTNETVEVEQKLYRTTDIEKLVGLML